MNSDQVTKAAFVELLMLGKVDKFNQLKESTTEVDLRGGDFCGRDLRTLEADNLDMRDCRLGHADLRGIDFSNTRLGGASIDGAKISGTLFPSNISAQEINLSLVHGTRMRETP